MDRSSAEHRPRGLLRGAVGACATAAAGAVLNTALSHLNAFAGSPVFLDTVFTGVAAVIGGPVIGACTGALTNVLLAVSHSNADRYLAFAFTNAAVGIVIGLAFRSPRLSLARVSWSLLAVVGVSAAVGAVTNYILGDMTTHGSVFALLLSLRSLGVPMPVSVILAHLSVHALDKGFTVAASVVTHRYAALTVRGHRIAGHNVPKKRDDPL